MSYINFAIANCKNCYKCLRTCPVKAIKFENQQAEIIEQRCISCGHCLAICPQNARSIKSNKQLVIDAIRNGKKVIASIAPSFPGYFDNMEPGKLIAAMKKLGFSIIEETAVGAEIVSDLYGDYIKNTNQLNYITTCCPSANALIEKYYPALTKYMIPVDSPMIAHGKLLRKEHGGGIFIAFIGPCVAKIIESAEFQDNTIINAAITFDELRDWIESSDINIDELQEMDLDKVASVKGAGFPILGGSSCGLERDIDYRNKELLKVSGIYECKEVLRAINDGDLEAVCLELNACKGSCVGGPEMIKEEKNFYKRQRRVVQYINKKKQIADESKYESNINCSKNFYNKSLDKVYANEDEIKKIMRDMGKFDVSDELNCGVCGYDTCRAKAQAVFEGMAEIDMCLNFMRNKAERITNVIFDNSPSVIMLLDEELNILEMNPAAEDTFVTIASQIKGKPISTIIDNQDIIKVIETKKDIIGKRVSYPNYNGIFIQNIVYLEKQNIILITMSNIIEIEKNKKELMRVRQQTLNAAQEVINKQMRVAQEIASLLGETTAETKITLSNLKKMVQGEDGGL